MRPQQSVRSTDLRWVLLCFFLSGTASLIYEVAWVKALGLIFGHTVYAVAVVLAVFMGGLAAGSAYLGRWSTRRLDPVTLYARIELLIGACGVLSIAGLPAVQLLYVAIYPTLGHSRILLIGIRLLGSAFVLFIPTFLMGGTLPILVAGTSYAELSLRVSRLYWTNTAGAVLGTLLAGFLLLPELGLRLTIGSAAAVNVAAALLVLRIRAGGALLKKDLFVTAEAVIRKPNRALSLTLLCLFGVVGCSALIYEIAWTRLLAVAVGSSTYAFTIMLAAFLLGIVIGSIVFDRLWSRFGRFISLTSLSWVQVSLGIAAVCSLIAFHWVPSVVPGLLRAAKLSFAGIVATQFTATALTLLPTAILFGFGFPMFIALLDRYANDSHSSSALVGNAYAANTLGAIFGSLAAGFWLIPHFGSFRVISAVAGVNVLVAIYLHLRTPQNRLVNLTADSALILVAWLVASSSFFNNPQLLSLSAVLSGTSYQGRLTSSEVAATKDLVYTAEGVNDSIAVVRSDGDVALRVNGKVDASTEDARTQLLLGHLGAALHPSPRRVLVIGFGSGMTVSAVARYPDVQRIDCVEIEPAVIRAAPYLRSLNRDVLRDPRVHVVVDDARNFLLTSRERYDLIISEPSNPWIAGIATLFTNEFYAAARQRLSPGGMFIQWVQAYSLAPSDLQMIIGTFAPHFPEVTLWRAGQTDLLLLGRTDTGLLGFDRLHSLWRDPGIRADFAALNVNQPEGLIAYFLLSDSAVRKLARGSRLNTDDRTLLEYDAPRSLLNARAIDADQDLIARFRQSPLPPNLDPRETGRALQQGLETALDLDDATTARAIFRLDDVEPESAAHEIARARVALLCGATAQAEKYLGAALKLEPTSPDAAYWLATAERRSGNVDAAFSQFQLLLKWHPKFLPALEDEMELAADRNDIQAALSAQVTRMTLLPRPPAYEYGRLGALWIRTSNFEAAESALLKGLAQDPYCYACHFELGELYLRTSKFPLAQQNLQWVVRFFPESDPAAFRLLAGVDLILRDKPAAQRVLNEGLRLYPKDPALMKAQAELGG